MGKYCTLPFTSFQASVQQAYGKFILSGYPCCRDWLKDYNMYKWAVDLKPPLINNKSYIAFKLKEVFNTASYIHLRESIANGSYALCSNECPYLAEFDKLPFGTGSNNNLSIDMYTDITTVGCNSKCIHCGLWNRSNNSEVIKVINSINDVAYHNITSLNTVTTGEPFAQQNTILFFKTFKHSEYPKLKNIHSVTNAISLTPSFLNSWSSDIFEHLKLSFNISLDAASAPTSAEIKRVDVFKTIVDNVTNLIKVFGTDNVQLSFIVSAVSYPDIPLLLDLMGKMGATKITFYYYNDRVGNAAMYRYMNVLHKTHPARNKVVDILQMFLDGASKLNYTVKVPVIEGINA